MKTLLFCLVFPALAFALDGITIPNSHQVDLDGQVFRGREPKEKVSELPNIGITDVIIFKTDTRGEVEAEKVALKKLKIKFHHIPFQWKEFTSLEDACVQIVDALSIIKKVKAKDGKVFFHCTAGEDRTGALAGVFRMLDEGLTMKKVFREEMCARGYSDGNENKPALVTGAIERELTPLFVAMAQKIEETGKLTKSSCRTLNIRPTKLRCRR